MFDVYYLGRYTCSIAHMKGFVNRICKLNSMKISKDRKATDKRCFPLSAALSVAFVCSVSDYNFFSFAYVPMSFLVPTLSNMTSMSLSAPMGFTERISPSPKVG